MIQKVIWGFVVGSIETGFCAICVQYGFILTSIEGFEEEEDDFVRWVLQFGIIDFERVLSEKL
jgi:hypothetical protein